MKTKILKIENDVIYFENGLTLSSDHQSDCCESHYLDFKELKEEDFKDLEFDLSNDEFFTRIPDYGIQLNATNNFPLRIPGYGYNNGYYSDQLDLILTNNKDFRKIYNITECQVIEG
jgi:hypothetical protein